jgi:predicted regulator of Ras-like GTPase activity (Roadblock/LC7/MglB family)
MIQKTRPLSRSQALVQELNKLYRYGCHEVLLVDVDGLLVSSVPSLSSSSDVAALAVRLAGIAQRMSRQAGLGSSDEVSVRTSSGMKLVCRTFAIEDQVFSLVFILRRKHQYRRITNRAIQSIQRIWSNDRREGDGGGRDDGKIER